MKRAFSLLLLAGLVVGCDLGMKTLERDGHRLYEMGKYDEATAKYREVLQKDPSRKEMNLYIARAQQDDFMGKIGTEHSEDEAAEAIELWEKVKELYPGDSKEFSEAESQISFIIDKTGGQEIGYEYYRKLIKKDDSPGNYMHLAKFLFETELRFSEGVDALDEGLAKHPDDKWLLLTKSVYLWAWVYKEKTLPVELKAELVDRGMEAVEHCIEVAPELATPYSYRNLLYRQKAEIEPDKAEEYMQLAQEDVKRFQERWPAEKAMRDELAGVAPPPATPPPGT